MPEGALGGVEREGWGSGGATQVSEIPGPAELRGIFPGQAAGSWKPSVPGKEKDQGSCQGLLLGTRTQGRGQDSPTQPGKMKPFCLGSCWWGRQKPNGRLLGSPWGCDRVKGAMRNPGSPGGQRSRPRIRRLLSLNHLRRRLPGVGAHAHCPWGASQGASGLETGRWETGR